MLKITISSRKVEKRCFVDIPDCGAYPLEGSRVSFLMLCPMPDRYLASMALAKPFACLV
jgi:hypothetical protein